MEGLLIICQSIRSVRSSGWSSLFACNCAACGFLCCLCFSCSSSQLLQNRPLSESLPAVNPQCPFWAFALWTSVCSSVHATCSHTACPASACVTPMCNPSLPSCSTVDVLSEPRAAEGPGLWPHSERWRPDLHIWWHCDHSQWCVWRWGGGSCGVRLEREWKTERQHLRGGTGAWAGLPRAGAAEPWHTPGFPDRGSCLTFPSSLPALSTSLTWPPDRLALLSISCGQSVQSFRDKTKWRYGSRQEGRFQSDWAPSRPGSRVQGSFHPHYRDGVYSPGDMCPQDPLTELLWFTFTDIVLCITRGETLMQDVGMK